MQLKDRPIINVDVDGVLYDFTAAMRTEVHAVMGIPKEELPYPDQWSIHESWPISAEQFNSIMYDGIAHGRVFVNGGLMGGVETRSSLYRLRKNGWHVRIVTSKTFRDGFVTLQARKSTLDWLDRQEVPYDTISFTSSDIGKQGLLADAVVDDKPDMSWTQYGADNFLFDQPWNQPSEVAVEWE